MSNTCQSKLNVMERQILTIDNEQTSFKMINQSEMLKIVRQFICLLVCFYASFVGAQSSSTAPTQTYSAIPPTPTAAAMARYGEIPVSHVTGVPEISVPIFTIKEGKLSLPLNFSYHASGVKVQDIATPIGLGWVLNAGGVVSRTVFGFQDGTMSKYGYKTSADLQAARSSATTTTSLGDLLGEMEMSYSSKDSHSDRFAYNFNGRSGIFRKDYISGDLFTIPYATIKIREYSTSEAPSGGYEIIDDQGNIYAFQEPETTSGGVSGGSSITSWLLTSITSADLKHVISFTYDDETIYYQKQISQSIEYGQSHNYWLDFANWTSIYLPVPLVDDGQFIDNLYDNQANFVFASKNLVKIESDHVVVNFIYTKNRVDIANMSSLNKIEIVDKLSLQTVKTVKLNHSYFGSSMANNRRFRLDGVDVATVAETAIESYQFAYNSTELPPYHDINSRATVYYEDYWGYYNSTTGSPSLIPKEYVPASDIYRSGDRNPNESLTKACVLEQITYPTGGRTVFEFELNRAAGVPIHDYDTYSSMHCCDGFDNSLLGGLRLKKIKNYDNTSLTDPATEREYEYEVTHASFTYMYKEMFSYSETYKYMFFPQSGYGWLPFATPELFQQFFGNSLLPLTSDYSSPVAYGEITEYVGSKTSNTGKIVYTYLGNPHHFPDPGILGHPRYLNAVNFDGGNYIPLLSEKTVFGSDGSGGYIKLQKTANQYSYLKQVTHNTGLNLHRNLVLIPQGASAPTSLPYWGSIHSQNDVYDSFEFSDTYGYEDVPLLTQTIQEEYDMNGTQKLSTQTDYTYGSLTHLQPTQLVTHDSKQNEIKTQNKYPVDFSSTGAYTAMLTKNILTPLVEKKTFNNNVLIRTESINYKEWGSDIIEPENIKIAKASNASEIELSYDQYDGSGNITQVTQRDGLKKAIVWGYNASYPIAEAVNSTVASVAATSFEISGKGNWDYDAAYCTTTSSITGKQSFTLFSGASVTTHNTLSNGEYIITYWSNSGAANVNGSTATALITKGGWTLYSHSVTNPGIVTVGISSGSLMIDELRLYPKQAQMNTYTYQPLVGMTSQCDTNNRISYFEYDAFGRLLRVRDQDNNILKSFEYKYKEAQ
jgi:YD repeat-containing protein